MITFQTQLNYVLQLKSVPSNRHRCRCRYSVRCWHCVRDWQLGKYTWQRPAWRQQLATDTWLR